MTRVAVSLLNYNSSQSTIACVQSLLSGYHEDGGSYGLEIFVADNDSTTDEQHQLQQSLAELAHVRLHVNSRNRGFAAGHNGNLEEIFLQSSPDYIWILNNDCLVYEDTLSSLLKCAKQRPDVGVWGATLLEPDGETVQCAGGCFYNSWISSYRQHGRGKTRAQINQLEPVDTDYIAGASLFFPVATLQNGLRSLPKSSIGEHEGREQWLNESFFLYFEELDLAKRLEPGLGMAWCKEALIKHSGGASTGANSSQRNALAEYHSTLSALKFTRQYYPRRLWVMAPARYFSKFLLLVLRGEFRLIGSLSRAYRDFWSGSDGE